MFLLRCRAPERYSQWLDRKEASQPSEAPTALLSYHIGRMLRAAWAAFSAALDGRAPPRPESEEVDQVQREILH